MRLITLLVLLLLYIAPSLAKDEGEIGHYTMNGVTFAIPKKALLVSMPEGEVDGSLPILLRWPNLEPAQWKGDQSQVIHVSMQKGGYSRTTMASGEEISRSYQWYGTISRIFRTEVISEEKRIYKHHINADPVFLYNAKGLGLEYYKLPFVGHPNVYNDDFFIKGDPLKPDYWIHCNLTRCDSAFELNNRVTVKYSFNRLNFLHGNVHEEVRKAIIDKLNLFIVTPEGE